MLNVQNVYLFIFNVHFKNFNTSAVRHVDLIRKYKSNIEDVFSDTDSIADSNSSSSSPTPSLHPMMNGSVSYEESASNPVEVSNVVITDQDTRAGEGDGDEWEEASDNFGV